MSRGKREKFLRNKVICSTGLSADTLLGGTMYLYELWFVAAFILLVDQCAKILFAPDQKVWTIRRPRRGATHYRLNTYNLALVWENGPSFWSDKWYFHAHDFGVYRNVVKCKFQIRLYDRTNNKIILQKTWRETGC